MIMAEDKEFWRWTEYTWRDEAKNWRDGEIITAGIDVGSVSSQAVIAVDGGIYSFNNMRTGSNSPDSATKAIEGAMKDTGMTLNDIHFVVGTGYGRVNVPFAHKAVTEIACHARGANFMGGPEIRTILDMGGQDCKAIHCDEKGKVTNFKMNDKCAAGTGRGMEVMADLLHVPITEVGDMSFRVDQEPKPVSSTCVVFAKSEAMALLRDGWSKERVLAAYCSAMAHRVVSLLQSVGVQQKFFITGGIAKNRGVVERLEKEIGITAVKTKYDSQIAGALGAALFAKTLYEKRAAKEVA